MRIPRSGLAPVLAIIVMGLFIGLNWYAGARSDDISSGWERSNQDYGARTVYIERFYDLDPGDRVDFSMGMFSGQDLVRDKIRFYVVEGGEGDAFTEGKRPQHVLHESGFWYGKKSFYRPEPYSGKPHEQGLNGDLHYALDFVWVYTPTPGTTADRLRSEDLAYRSTIENFGFEVYDDAWLRTQWVALAGAGLSAVAAVGLIVTWTRARRDPAIASGPIVERLVALQERATGYLLLLRNMMLLAGAFLLMGAAAIVVLAVLAIDLEPAQPFEGWEYVVVGAIAGLLMLVIAMWAIQYRRIGQEHRRWVADRPPIDLSGPDA